MWSPLFLVRCHPPEEGLGETVVVVVVVVVVAGPRRLAVRQEGRLPRKITTAHGLAATCLVQPGQGTSHHLHCRKPPL